MRLYKIQQQEIVEKRMMQSTTFIHIMYGKVHHHLHASFEWKILFTDVTSTIWLEPGQMHTYFWPKNTATTTDVAKGVKIIRVEQKKRKHYFLL